MSAGGVAVLVVLCWYFGGASLATVQSHYGAAPVSRSTAWWWLLGSVVPVGVLVAALLWPSAA